MRILESKLKSKMERSKEKRDNDENEDDELECMIEDWGGEGGSIVVLCIMTV